MHDVELSLAYSYYTDRQADRMVMILIVISHSIISMMNNTVLPYWPLGFKGCNTMHDVQVQYTF